jgi:hypothetical protein
MEVLQDNEVDAGQVLSALSTSLQICNFSGLLVSSMEWPVERELDVRRAWSHVLLWVLEWFDGRFWTEFYVDIETIICRMVQTFGVFFRFWAARGSDQQTQRQLIKTTACSI